MALPITDAPSTAERIVEAATNQFFARGYHGASMKELAAEAGVRSATLYYHFPNKEEILVEIMRTTLDELTATVRAAVAPQLDPEAALRTAVTTHIHFHVDRHREVFLCDAKQAVRDCAVRFDGQIPFPAQIRVQLNGRLQCELKRPVRRILLR